MLATCDGLLRETGAHPAAIGITNQRETLVVFDRRTLEPVAPAIVWQCRRSAAICAEHRARGEEPEIRRRTGLLLDPYFTATKLEWLLRDDPALAARAERGELCAGTVDTWLIARLTAGAALVTDAEQREPHAPVRPRPRRFRSRAVRALRRPDRRSCPAIHPSAGQFGTTDPAAFLGLAVPISGIAGDQQAALFGQACIEPGMSKNTYGTGSFLLVNVGGTVPDPGDGPAGDGRLAHRRPTTSSRSRAASSSPAPRCSGCATGSGSSSSAADAGPLFESVPDSRGCIFVPALAGLGAPWWDPEARGALLGLTAGRHPCPRRPRGR